MISQNFYESHNHPDPLLPVIFHLDTMNRKDSSFLTHWHEDIEILYVVEGTITVLADANSITAG